MKEQEWMARAEGTIRRIFRGEQNDVRPFRFESTKKKYRKLYAFMLQNPNVEFSQTVLGKRFHITQQELGQVCKMMGVSSVHEHYKSHGLHVNITSYMLVTE